MILPLKYKTNIDRFKFNDRIGYITSKIYPEQDEKYIGKKIRVPFSDQTETFIRARFPISQHKYPEYDGLSSNDNHLFTIVRFDKDYPGKIIAIDHQYRVLLLDKDWIDTLIYYPGFTPEENEVVFRQAETWEEFNREYKTEKIYQFPIQMEEMLGTLVFSEYYNDIINYDSGVNRLSMDYQSQFKTFEQIKEQLLIGNPALKKVPDCILKSFPHYFNRHYHDRSNIPRRAINTGVVIRCDNEAAVILEILEDGSYRYVCDDEGFFYYESESERSNIKELDIWQLK